MCEQSLVSLEIQQRELEIGELSIVRHFERLVEEAENDKKAEIDEICRKYLQKTDRISAEKKLIEAKHYEERNKAVCFKK